MKKMLFIGGLMVASLTAANQPATTTQPAEQTKTEATAPVITQEDLNKAVAEAQKVLAEITKEAAKQETTPAAAAPATK